MAGAVRFGRYGPERCVKIRFGKAWQVWCGMVRRGEVRSGKAWYGRFGMVGCGEVRSGPVWLG
ncbi:hypothetical protein LCGC14_1934370 [marine sediment metagenome]|uniref:Uncharacterized protein n=1 Tax=marine sediment metagenome TaxID=412755 RepID=A0A0F9I0S0_9ZZZZ